MEELIDSLMSEVKNRGSLIGRRILLFEEVDSTQDIAKNMLNDLEEGSVIIAQRQRKGRGRRGRKWVTLPGTLNFSVLFKPRLELIHVSTFPLMAGVAITYAVKNLTHIPVSIKWPNDLYIRDKKFCGILCETVGKKDALSIILGIGINVNTPEDFIPRDIKSFTTSLSVELGKEIFIKDLLLEIFLNLERFYLDYKTNGFSNILVYWKKLNNTLGKEVKVIIGGKEFNAFANDISEDGGLIVTTTDGRELKLLAADVSVRFV